MRRSGRLGKTGSRRDVLSTHAGREIAITTKSDVDENVAVNAPTINTEPQPSIARRQTFPSKTLKIAQFQQISITCLKLVRDQGVGGSNPLSPTNKFNSLLTLNKLNNRPTGFGPGSLGSEGASFLAPSLNNGCRDSYKIVYSQIRLCPLSCGTFWFF
jgi:hypothetical protein